MYVSERSYGLKTILILFHAVVTKIGTQDLNSALRRLQTFCGHKFQRTTMVLIRLGTSPAGMMATSWRFSVSMAETERSPEFETYRTFPSGVKVIHSGTEPVGFCPCG